MKFLAVVVTFVFLSIFAATDSAQADHSFAQFGETAQILAPGEGVEYLLGGHEDPGFTDPSVVFHLHLFFNEGGATGPSQLTFSPGDVLRFTLGDTSVIYEFDQPADILTPPFFSTGFFDAGNIDDTFAAGDPIGVGLAAADVDGQTMTLEVLAGDGVRFSGLEMADLDAGTFRKAGASTLVRKYAIAGGDTVAIDFDSLTPGDIVTDQYSTSGVTFWGDVVFEEQYIVDRLGVGLDVIDMNFIVNGSATPPLDRSKFVGVSFDRAAHSLAFDYAATETELRVAGFNGPFAPETLTFIESFSPAPGATPFLEGSVLVVHPDGFDGVIIPAKKSVLIDHVQVTFRRVAGIDFDGLSLQSRLFDQFESLGVHFFGDGLTDEQSTIDAGGFAYELLDGTFLVNDTTTPPTGDPGTLGVAFDAPVSRLRFDFASSSPIQVVVFLGGFSPGNVVGAFEFTPSLGPSNTEGRVLIESSVGFDGVIIDPELGLAIDNVVAEFRSP